MKQNELLKEYRGVVFNGDKLIMRAFPYTINVEVDDNDYINRHIKPKIDSMTFFPSYEGFLIRMLEESLWDLAYWI